MPSGDIEKSPLPKGQGISLSKVHREKKVNLISTKKSELWLELAVMLFMLVFTVKTLFDLGMDGLP